MNKFKKISVIVPVYNASKLVGKLIESLKDQTYRNLELIFIDNNSEDDSFEYLKKMAKTDNRIIVLSEKRQGPNYARLTGFIKSSGEYIYFCDADDYLESDAMENLINCISKTKAEVVIGDYNEVTPEYIKIKTKPGVNIKDSKNNLKIYNEILLMKPALWNKIFKRDLITEDIFSFGFLGEDMVISLAAMAKAKKVYYINKIIYNYVILNSGLASTVNPKRLQEVIKSHENLHTIFKKYNLWNKYKEELIFITFSHLTYYMLRSALISENIKRLETREVMRSYLNQFDYKKNIYYKKKIHYHIADKVVKHKSIYNLGFTRFMIKNIFSNKSIFKLIKMFDK